MTSESVTLYSARAKMAPEEGYLLERTEVSDAGLARQLLGHGFWATQGEAADNLLRAKRLLYKKRLQECEDALNGLREAIRDVGRWATHNPGRVAVLRTADGAERIVHIDATLPEIRVPIFTPSKFWWGSGKLEDSMTVRTYRYSYSAGGDAVYEEVL